MTVYVDRLFSDVLNLYGVAFVSMIGFCISNLKRRAAEGVLLNVILLSPLPICRNKIQSEKLRST